MEPYPSQEWLEAVGTALGVSTDVIKALVEGWIIMGKTTKEMEERLIFLASLNGKKLVFTGAPAN